MNAAITNPINLIVIIIGTFLGLALGFFLLFNKSAKNQANLYLGGILLALTTHFLAGFFNRFELLDDFPHILGSHRLAGFLYGPLAYFYVRACIQEGFKMRPKLWLHFIPVVLDFLIDFPFFLQSGAEKYAYYEQLSITGDLSNSGIIYMKAIHAAIYYLIAIQLILQYQKHLNNATSYIDTAFHRWVLVFITSLALPVIAQLIFVFTEFQHGLFLMVFSCFFVFIFSVFIAALVKPELFHTFPHQMLLPKSSKEKKQKYERSTLQDVQKDKYIEKLQAYIVMNKPYLKPELTLTQVADYLDIPSHFLSQAINEKLQVTFLDFINNYRVKAAQEKLMDAKLSHYTIISIAYEAGFNAKSTFYAAFKKETGITPSQYRKQQAVAIVD